MYNNPVMNKNTYINGNASSTKATEATITNLNPTVSQSNNGSCNEGYKIYNDRYDKQPIGVLYKYECHLYGVMTYGTTYTKEYCGYLKDGLMIGYTPECGIGKYEEANNNRKLFHDFLKRYMGGEFKYRKSFHHASKPLYYHDLPKQVQRNIKRVVDTLNDIYAA